MLPQVRSIKFPMAFDAEKLKNEVTKILGSEWKNHYNTNDYTGNWQVIALMSADGKTDSIQALASTAANIKTTNVLEKMPYINQILADFKFEKTAVRLLNLAAGAVIKPHKDYCLGYEDGSFRLHIPIITNPDVVFILDEKRIIMNEGECWYIDANFTHSVRNEGEADRIHLVIDGLRNQWSDALFFKEAQPEQFLTPKTPMDAATKNNMIEALKLLNTPVALQIIKEMEG